MGNAPIYKPYEGFVVLLQRNLRQLFIRTQIAIPTGRKHRYLQRKERYEESLKLLYLFVAITALYKPNRQLHNTNKTLSRILSNVSNYDLNFII